MIHADVLVVGAGPGGYAAAERAGHLGLSTVLVEADRLGGTCLIRGCIPSKALIHAAEQVRAMQAPGPLGITLPAPPAIDLAQTVRWKEGVVDKLSNGVRTLMNAAKARVLTGWAEFTDAKTCTVTGPAGVETIQARHVILATGSEPASLPGLPWGGPVISSTEALLLDHVPRRLLVVGGGYIGLELGTAFAKLGAAVTVIEAQDRILPTWDAPLTDPVRRAMEGLGMTILTGAKLAGVEVAGELARAAVQPAGGPAQTIEADRVLVTVGRRPRTQGWGLERMAIDMNGPFIAVDDACRTSMRGVFAIGDLVGEPMLAHKATAQGMLAAEVIAGSKARFEPVAIPACCFTDPEIVSAGLTPTDPGGSGAEIIAATYPFAANGRALTLEAGHGFVRVLARRDDHRLLGVQAVGPGVSELSGEFTLALEMGSRLEDIVGTIHAHPSLTEAFHEAARRALDVLARQ